MQRERSLASAARVGVSQRSLQKASGSETRSRAGGRRITHSQFLYEPSHFLLAITYRIPYTTTMPTSHFYYVYILRDIPTGKHHYTGVAHGLQERLSMHNAGHVPHTSKFAPWYRETAVAFRDKEKIAYKLYLKIGTGRAYY